MALNAMEVKAATTVPELEDEEGYANWRNTMIAKMGPNGLNGRNRNEKE